MADINHLISLGIGSPAAIPEFITFGLQIGVSTSEVEMRNFGSNENHKYPVSPDTVAVVNISSAGAVVAQDYPEDAHLWRFASTMEGFFLNPSTTAIALPAASYAASTASSLATEYIINGDIRQINSNSTGYSITSPSSGLISISFWSK